MLVPDVVGLMGWEMFKDDANEKDTRGAQDEGEVTTSTNFTNFLPYDRVSSWLVCPCALTQGWDATTPRHLVTWRGVNCGGEAAGESRPPSSLPPSTLAHVRSFASTSLTYDCENEGFRYPQQGNQSHVISELSHSIRVTYDYRMARLDSFRCHCIKFLTTRLPCALQWE